MCPVILNGITDFVNRGDLIDRCLFVHLSPIPETSRRTEKELWADFDREAPRLLGALLDAVAGGLRMLPHVQLSSLPRMADFALLGKRRVGRWDIRRITSWAPTAITARAPTSRRWKTRPWPARSDD